MIEFLIVEDETLVALEIKQCLSDLGYTKCFTAQTPEKALEIITTRDISLMFVDVKLKNNIEGIELVEKVRELQKDIECIYITAFSDEDVVERAIKTEPLTYLTKPFKIRDLKVQIKIFENRKIVVKETQENLIYFFNKEFTYNTLTKELCQFGIVKKIPKREVKLLELIVKNLQKKFISNLEIEYAVWGETFVQDSTRRVVVSSLNRKFNNRLLRSDYKNGYLIFQ